MKVVVELSVSGTERPPGGAPVRVEVQDTSIADAPAVRLGGVDGVVGEATGQSLGVFEVELASLPRGCTIWAHVDVDENGRVSRGDFLTTVAFPVPQGERVTVPVTVQKI